MKFKMGEAFWFAKFISLGGISRSFEKEDRLA